MSGLRKFFSSSITNSSACLRRSLALADSLPSEDTPFNFLGGGEGVLLALLALQLLPEDELLLELLLLELLEAVLLQDELELEEEDDACLPRRRPSQKGGKKTLTLH